MAGYSDCANISSPQNQLLTRWDVSRGGGDATNMWGGPFGDPEWSAHDPYVNAEKLRGKTIYMSSGNGVPPGRYNNLVADPIGETVQGIIGEFGSWSCTGQMSNRLSRLGIPLHHQPAAQRNPQMGGVLEGRAARVLADPDALGRIALTSRRPSRSEAPAEDRIEVTPAAGSQPTHSVRSTPAPLGRPPPGR